jgi:hypothetical protein
MLGLQPVDDRAELRLRRPQPDEHVLVLDGVVGSDRATPRRAERAQAEVVLPHRQPLQQGAGLPDALVVDDAGVATVVQGGEAVQDAVELGAQVVVHLHQELLVRRTGARLLRSRHHWPVGLVGPHRPASSGCIRFAHRVILSSTKPGTMAPCGARRCRCAPEEPTRSST